MAGLYPEVQTGVHTSVTCTDQVNNSRLGTVQQCIPQNTCRSTERAVLAAVRGAVSAAVVGKDPKLVGLIFRDLPGFVGLNVHTTLTT